VILAKPETFMNLSGDMVARLVEIETIEPVGLLVVHDELDLPLGRVQVKRGGGSAGHRGVQSIIDRIARNDFPRVRIGVGKPSPDDQAIDFVLGGFAPDEREQAEDVLERATTAAETWLVAGLDVAMSRCNVRPRREPGQDENA
jgi:PTH1 family peptidyl-tRNA hydrolase